MFIEDDEEKRQKKFNFEHFKASYNGRIMRVTGKATQGNETHTPKFRSSIVVGQNAKVEGSQALRERFIELFYDKSGFNQKTLEAAMKIESYKTDQLCGYRHYLLSHQQTLFPELIKHYETGLEELRRLAADQKEGPLKNNRIVQNYAVIYGAAKVLQGIFPLFNEVLWERFQGKLVKLALESQTTTSEDTHLVQLFFETLDYLAQNGIDLNHSRNEQFIAVNLTQFMSVCGKLQIRGFDDVQQLRRELKNSTFYKFMESNKATFSVSLNGTIKCWVFKKPE